MRQAVKETVVLLLLKAQQSTVVQEVIPIVTDVQLDESSEEDAQEEYLVDIPCATLCVNIDLACRAGSPSNVESTTVAYPRPAIIFANAIKPTPDSIVGLQFRARDGAVYISRIVHDSLFHGCNLMVGDLVVAVNNISCIGVK
jgi:hypothetical protein